MKVACATLVVLAMFTNASAQNSELRESNRQKACTSATLEGVWGYVAGPGLTGLGTGAPERIASIGTITFDGVGRFSGPIIISQEGVIIRTIFAGTYTVRSDCTATLVYGLGGAPPTLVNESVIVDDGNEVFSLIANAGQVWTSIAKRVSSRK